MHSNIWYSPILMNFLRFNALKQYQTCLYYVQYYNNLPLDALQMIDLSFMRENKPFRVKLAFFNSGNYRVEIFRHYVHSKFYFSR